MDNSGNTASTATMSKAQRCDICGIDTRDSLSHHLLEHPGSPVPREIVVEWVRLDPGRCAECYRPVTDLVVHKETYHVPIVYLVLKEHGYWKEIRREENNTLVCPWCIEAYHEAREFESHAEACGLFNIAHELRMEEAERAIERSCNQAVGR